LLGQSLHVDLPEPRRGLAELFPLGEIAGLGEDLFGLVERYQILPVRRRPAAGPRDDGHFVDGHRHLGQLPEQSRVEQQAFAMVARTSAVLYPSARD